MLQIVLNDSIVIENGMPYFIAEVNSSHEGNIETAREMLDAAVNCGCNCVKFQSWFAKMLYYNLITKKIIAKCFVGIYSLDEEQLHEMADFCTAVQKCLYCFGFKGTHSMSIRIRTAQKHAQKLSLYA